MHETDENESQSERWAPQCSNGSRWIIKFMEIPPSKLNRKWRHPIINAWPRSHRPHWRMPTVRFSYYKTNNSDNNMQLKKRQSQTGRAGEEKIEGGGSINWHFSHIYTADKFLHLCFLFLLVFFFLSHRSHHKIKKQQPNKPLLSFCNLCFPRPWIWKSSVREKVDFFFLFQFLVFGEATR